MTPQARLTVAAALAVLAIAPSKRIYAQRGPGAAPSRGPGWVARQSYLSPPYFTEKVTPAERAAILARLLEIERIVLQTPEIARPVGFEIEPTLYAGNRADPRAVIGSTYTHTIYNPTKKIAGEGCGCVAIMINNFAGGLKSPYSDERGEIYFEDELGDPVKGALRVWGSLSPTEPTIVTVMFTAGGGSPWKTVTRENFLRAVIAQAEGKNGEKLAEARQFYSRTPYEQWLAEAPVRKRQRDGTLAALTSAQREEVRKELETTERETGELLKAAHEADRTENARALAGLTERGDGFRARIVAMSAAERTTPAWIDRMDTSGQMPFVAPGSPNGMQIMQLDSGFFHPRRSRIEARTIVVKISARGTGHTPEVQPALWALFQKLDWAALQRLLEPL